MAQVKGDSSVAGAAAVVGVSIVARGVEGHSTKDHAVVGVSVEGTGVFGVGTKGRGVEGESTENHAIVGTSKGKGTGVFGVGIQGRGVEGRSTENHAIVGNSLGKGAGVFGITENGNGVEGHSTNQIGVFGKGGRLAGKFEGNVEVTGVLTTHNKFESLGDIFCKGDIKLPNEDCAEDFDVVGCVEPGTVMVVTEDGALRESHQPYDKCVAGVISGAGSYRPGIVLGKRESATNRLPVGLLGKVYCKVDAESSPIGVGDLLTTSCTPGHAMKAIDPSKAFGAVIGKALGPQKEGHGLIPILISLQ